jgi:hypothetical protein
LIKGYYVIIDVNIKANYHQADKQRRTAFGKVGEKAKTRTPVNAP